MIKSFKIITLFPEIFEPLLKTKVFERAGKRVNIELINLRDYSIDKHRTVDDTPYGGGCGMILKPEPLGKLFDELKTKSSKRARVICLSPQGKVFNQEMAKSIAENEESVLLCGRYEGIDQRVIDLYVDEEISIGDYVLSGGELPAMVIMETVLRLIPGVLGNEESSKTDTFSNGMLKYPQYTRPEVFAGLKVPQILLSGNHEKIADWRKKKSIEKTKKNRPDLISDLKKEDRDVLKDIQ